MRKDYRAAHKASGAAEAHEAVPGRVSVCGSVRQDYSVYRFSRKELGQAVLAYVVLDGCVSYLFFFSGVAFLVLLPGMAVFIREWRRTLQKRRRQEMKQQFLDGIQMVAASLQAGYSAENALCEALKELRRIYPADAFIVREFGLMEVQMEMSRNLEELFLDFGRRCAIEDIRSFAEVFMTAKRSGGDLLGIIRNTVSCIRQKQETMQEIETCLSGKVMEQNIMSVIPILILAYIRLTSPEFIEPMYGNLTGTAVMTVCFLVYAAAYFWGRRIVQIEV